MKGFTKMVYMKTVSTAIFIFCIFLLISIVAATSENEVKVETKAWYKAAWDYSVDGNIFPDKIFNVSANGFNVIFNANVGESALFSSCSECRGSFGIYSESEYRKGDWSKLYGKTFSGGDSIESKTDNYWVYQDAIIERYLVKAKSKLKMNWWLSASYWPGDDNWKEKVITAVKLPITETGKDIEADKFINLALERRESYKKLKEHIERFNSQDCYKVALNYVIGDIKNIGSAGMEIAASVESLSKGLSGFDSVSYAKGVKDFSDSLNELRNAMQLEESIKGLAICWAVNGYKQEGEIHSYLENMINVLNEEIETLKDVSFTKSPKKTIDDLSKVINKEKNEINNTIKQAYRDESDITGWLANAWVITDVDIKAKNAAREKIIPKEYNMLRKFLENDYKNVNMLEQKIEQSKNPTIIQIEQAKKKPDLKITEFYISAISAMAGDTVEIKVKVKNIGNVDIYQEKSINLLKIIVDSNSIKNYTFSGSFPVGTEEKEFKVKWTVTRGIHIIKIIADPDNVIDELNEFNNELYNSIIGVFPDLKILLDDFRISPEIPDVSELFTTEATIRNEGGANANNAKIKFEIVDKENYILNNKEVSVSIGVGQSKDVKLNWDGLPKGYYKIFVWNQYNELIFESFLFVSEHLANLEITKLELPSVMNLGEKTKINVTIKNTGTVFSSNFNLEVFKDDESIGKKTIDTLDVNNIKQSTFEWTPKNHGTFTIVVKVDGGNYNYFGKVKELNEGDNEARKDIEVRASDLVVKDFLISPKMAGDNIIEMNVSNIGDTEAKDVKIKVSITDSKGNPVGSLKEGNLYTYAYWHEFSLGNIKSGNTVKKIFTYFIDEEGNYKINLTVDPSNKIIETNENNNELIKQFAIKSKLPDLYVSSISITPYSPMINKQFFITTTIKNNGTIGASFIRVEFYDDFGNKISSDYIISSLESGKSTIANVTAQITSCLVKSIIVKVDGGNYAINSYIKEINENNNQLSKDISISPPPDLFVSLSTPKNTTVNRSTVVYGIVGNSFNDYVYDVNVGLSETADISKTSGFVVTGIKVPIIGGKSGSRIGDGVDIGRETIQVKQTKSIWQENISKLSTGKTVKQISWTPKKAGKRELNFYANYINWQINACERIKLNNIVSNYVIVCTGQNVPDLAIYNSDINLNATILLTSSISPSIGIIRGVETRYSRAGGRVNATIIPPHMIIHNLGMVPVSNAKVFVHVNNVKVDEFNVSIAVCGSTSIDLSNKLWLKSKNITISIEKLLNESNYNNNEVKI